MMINNCPYSGGSKKPPEFTYTGRYEYTQSGINWQLKLLTSGDLTFSRVNNARKIDVFLVGPGGNGAKGRYDHSVPGGSGGECKTFTAIRGEKTTYHVEIQEAGGKTTFGSLSAAGGQNGGGTGAGMPAFGEGDSPLYGKAGERGGWTSAHSGYDGAPGAPNTGEGGDGGNFSEEVWADGSHHYPTGHGGKGGTGIAIIRNAR